MTNGNRLEYIHRVANFRLNLQIKRATDAFRTGLEEVIAREWLAMFNEAELQVIRNPYPPSFGPLVSWDHGPLHGCHVTHPLISH